MMRKPLIAVLCLITLSAGSIFPHAALANLGAHSAHKNLSIDTDGHAEFDANGDLFISGSRAKTLPYSTTFLYNMDDRESRKGPVILGDVEVTTNDDDGGFYVYGYLNYIQSRVESGDMTIQTANPESTSLAHMDQDGYVTSIVDLETDGTVKSIAYDPEANALFLAGDFSTVNGDPHRAVACIHPDTGSFCIIDGYDWSENAGFLTTDDQTHVTYDAVDDRIFLSGAIDSQYSEGSPATVFTALDPANPVENVAGDLLNTEMNERFNFRTGTQVLSFDSRADLDGNGITEKIIYLYNYPTAWVYRDNGEGYDSNTEFSLFGFRNAKFVEQEGPEVSSAAIFMLENFNEGLRELSIAKIPTSYGGGGFSYSMNLFHNAQPIFDPGTWSSTLSGAVISSNGDVYYGGDFSYLDDEGNLQQNVVAMNENNEQVLSGSYLSRNVTSVTRSGSNVLMTGSFQQSETETYDRSIIKINHQTGEVDNDFNLSFWDATNHTVDVDSFLIDRGYLYVYNADGAITQVRNRASDTVAEVPKTNLFRINLSTNTLDESFSANIEGDPEFDSIEKGDGLLYALANNTIYPINETTGNVDTDWQDNFTLDNEGISHDAEIRQIFRGNDANLYIVIHNAFLESNLIEYADLSGLFGTVLEDARFETSELLYEKSGNFFVAYRTEGGGMSIIGYDQTFGGLGVDIPFNDPGYVFSFEGGDAVISSMVIENGLLYVSGQFDTLTGDLGEGPETFFVTNFAAFDLTTGFLAEDSSVFNAMYTNYTNGNSVRLAYNAANSQMAVYGDYSYQLNDPFNGPPSYSLTDAPYGLVLFSVSDATPTLTEVEPIPSETTAEDALYSFALEGSTDGEYQFTQCSGAPGCEIRVDQDNHVVSFSGLKVGTTYNTTFNYLTEFGRSNTLTIGPFTVTRSPRHSSGGGGNSGGGSSIPVITPILEPTPSPVEPELPVTPPPQTTGPLIPIPENGLKCDATLYLKTPVRFGTKNNPDDVKLLEEFLNTYEGTNLAVNGIYEKTDFDAVVRWQEKYAKDILTPWGLTKGTGYVYTRSLQKIKEIHEANCATAPKPPVTTACLVTDRPLARGSSGALVTTAQNLLGRLSFFSGSPTGFFGPLTEQAVTAFQRAQGLSPVGIIGPQTREKLNTLGCK